MKSSSSKRIPKPLHGVQQDNEIRNALISKLCINERLRFREKQLPTPLPYDGTKAYAKQVEVWPNFNISQTVAIRINADYEFRLDDSSRNIIRTSDNGHFRSGYYQVFKLIQNITKTNSNTFTLVGSSPFKVICIDKLSSS